MDMLAFSNPALAGSAFDTHLTQSGAVSALTSEEIDSVSGGLFPLLFVAAATIGGYLLTRYH